MARCVSGIQGRDQGLAGQLEGGPHQSGKGTTLHLPSKMQRVLTETEQKFCCEVVLWKQFKHPNLLPLVGARKVSHSLIMVSEWMEHGTIMDFIITCPETNRLRLVSILYEAESERPSTSLPQLADVARGLEYLHDWPSVHADLKSVSQIPGGSLIYKLTTRRATF